MRIVKLKKIIAINVVISTILTAIFIGITIFIFNLNSISLKKIKKINTEISQINIDNNKNKIKLSGIKKYEQKWINYPEKLKSTKLLRSNQVNTIISQIAQRYFIKNLQFAMNVPSKMSSGKFKKDSIDTYYTSGNLSFGATDDIRALSFIKEISTALPGNIVIESLSLNKIRKYSNGDYITISREGKLSKVKVRLKFHWYSKGKK